MTDGRSPLLRENLADTDPPLQNVEFQSIFVRRSSVVTPSKKFN